jgi:hypothetical protein
VSQKLFYLFIFLYVLALGYLILKLPIGPHEAWVFYEDQGVLGEFTHLCEGCFGNQLDFRLPFFIFGLLNILLFFYLSKLYFSKLEDSYLSTTIFALLPGIITSAVIVNIAVIVITLVLGFIIFYENKQIFWQSLAMVLLLFVHDASVIFFIAVAIFAAFRRNQKLFYLAIFLSAISLLIFNGLDIGGVPKGKFLELFGLYMALFSPLVFVYFFYALYRIWLKEKKEILWYISFSAFVFSIFLSFRQQVIMTDFAPYVIVSVVLMVVIYHKTLYVRLPQFQKKYILGYRVVMASLILSSLIILFHSLLFDMIEDKSKHFAYPFYKPYWLALELKENGQNCYTTKEKREEYQLQYYGIGVCQDSNVPKIHN